MPKNLRNYPYLDNRWCMPVLLPKLIKAAKDNIQQLSALTIASALQGSEDDYRKAFSETEALLEKVNISQKAFYLSRLLFAADAMHDQKKVEFLHDQITPLISVPSETDDVYLTWALGYFASLSLKNYLAVNDNLQRRIRLLETKYSSTRRISDLADIIWAYILSLLAAAKHMPFTDYQQTLTNIKRIAGTDIITAINNSLTHTTDYPSWAFSLVSLAAKIQGDETLSLQSATAAKDPLEKAANEMSLQELLARLNLHLAVKIERPELSTELLLEWNNAFIKNINSARVNGTPEAVIQETVMAHTIALLGSTTSMGGGVKQSPIDASVLAAEAKKIAASMQNKSVTEVRISPSPIYYISAFTKASTSTATALFYTKAATATSPEKIFIALQKHAPAEGVNFDKQAFNPSGYEDAPPQIAANCVCPSPDLPHVMVPYKQNGQVQYWWQSFHRDELVKAVRDIKEERVQIGGGYTKADYSDERDLHAALLEKNFILESVDLNALQTNRRETNEEMGINVHDYEKNSDYFSQALNHDHPLLWSSPTRGRLSERWYVEHLCCSTEEPPLHTGNEVDNNTQGVFWVDVSEIKYEGDYFTHHILVPATSATGEKIVADWDTIRCQSPIVEEGLKAIWEHRLQKITDKGDGPLLNTIDNLIAQIKANCKATNANITACPSLQRVLTELEKSKPSNKKFFTYTNIPLKQLMEKMANYYCDASFSFNAQTLDKLLSVELEKIKTATAVKNPYSNENLNVTKPGASSLLFNVLIGSGENNVSAPRPPSPGLYAT